MNPLIFKIDNGTGIITLNRPEKLNSFNREMAILLQERLDECAGLHEIRSVLITGAGKAFSAGQDLAEIASPGGPSMSQVLSEHYNPIIRRIRNLPKPVIAAVNGIAAGAGANIALCCDIVIAAENASFIQAFSKIGLIPDSGGTFFLPRLIGWQKASAISMLGDRISANEAEKMGMIYRVFPAEEFNEQAFKLAVHLSGMPTHGLALTKHALNYSFFQTYEQQLEMEDRLQQEAAGTYDYREGIAAFLEKRDPVFLGQ